MPVEWNPKDSIDAARRGALRGVIMAANVLRVEIIRLIQETEKTGRTYTRRGIVHQASGPGEPPASDTGNLVRLINVEVDPRTATAKVVSSAEYSEFLELGTPQMEPRPFMRPAVDNKRAEIEQIIATEVEKDMQV